MNIATTESGKNASAPKLDCVAILDGEIACLDENGQPNSIACSGAAAKQHGVVVPGELRPSGAASNIAHPPPHH